MHCRCNVSFCIQTATARLSVFEMAVTILHTYTHALWAVVTITILSTHTRRGRSRGGCLRWPRLPIRPQTCFGVETFGGGVKISRGKFFDHAKMSFDHQQTFWDKFPENNFSTHYRPGLDFENFRDL